MKRYFLLISLISFLASSAFATETTSATKAPVKKVAPKKIAKKTHAQQPVAETPNLVHVSNVEHLGGVDVNVYGGVYVDGEFGDRNADNFDSYETIGGAHGQTAIVNAYLTTDFIINPNVSARIDFYFSPGATPNTATPTGLSLTPYALNVDQAYVTLKNKSLSAVIGEQYLPFGFYVTDNGSVYSMIIPFTELISLGDTVAVKGAYTLGDFTADAYVFQDAFPNVVNGVAANRRANVGADLVYDNKVNDDLEIKAQLGYIDNYLDLSVFETPYGNSSTTDASANALSEDTTITYKKMDLDVHAFRELSVSHGDITSADGGHPMTMDSTVGYSFTAFGDDSRAYVGYSHSWHLANFTGMPQSRVTLGDDVNLNVNTTLSLELARDDDYASSARNRYYMGVGRVTVLFG